MNFALYIKKNGKNYSINNIDSDIVKLEEKRENGRYTLVLKDAKDITIEKAVLSEKLEFDKDALFFCNGYQSWTDSYEYDMEDKQKGLKFKPYFLNKKFAFDRYGDYLFRKYKKHVLFGYDVTYITSKNELFIGSLNYDTAMLILSYDRKANTVYAESEFNNITVNGDITLFDFVNFDNVERGKEAYFSHFTPKTTKKLVGYTSWYNYYQAINENLINECLDSIDNRFDLFQIDDGFETFVGDWLNIDKTKFPNGLAGIVDKIHSKGLKAGVWLAPFACEEKSDVFKNHKDWLVSKNGKPYKCGGNWSGFYALDIYNPAALDYIKKSLQYYVDMNFDLFKLDFLYAECALARNNKTRAQIIADSYAILLDVLKGKEILGCGAVLAPAFGKFDYMRIGPDVSLEFDDVAYMRLFHRERISTKTTLRNSIYRSFLNGNVFMNDPDVFLLRDDNIKLSKEQRKALLTINALFGGVMMTSDNIGKYDDEKKATLEYALELFKNATDISFKREKNKIYISYNLNDKKNEIYYDIENGVLQEA